MVDERTLVDLEKFLLERKANSCKLSLHIRKEPPRPSEVFEHVVADAIIEGAGATKTIRGIMDMENGLIADYDTCRSKKRRLLGVGTAFVLPIAKHLQTKGITVVVDAPAEGIVFVRDLLQLPYGQVLD